MYAVRLQIGPAEDDWLWLTRVNERRMEFADRAEAEAVAERWRRAGREANVEVAEL